MGKLNTTVGWTPRKDMERRPSLIDLDEDGLPRSSMAWFNEGDNNGTTGYLPIVPTGNVVANAIAEFDENEAKGMDVDVNDNDASSSSLESNNPNTGHVARARSSIQILMDAITDIEGETDSDPVEKPRLQRRSSIKDRAAQFENAAISETIHSRPVYKVHDENKPRTKNPNVYAVALPADDDGADDEPRFVTISLPVNAPTAAKRKPKDGKSKDKDKDKDKDKKKKKKDKKKTTTSTTKGKGKAVDE